MGELYACTVGAGGLYDGKCHLGGDMARLWNKGSCRVKIIQITNVGSR